MTSNITKLRSVLTHLNAMDGGEHYTKWRGQRAIAMLDSVIEDMGEAPPANPRDCHDCGQSTRGGVHYCPSEIRLIENDLANRIINIVHTYAASRDLPTGELAKRATVKILDAIRPYLATPRPVVSAQQPDEMPQELRVRINFWSMRPQPGTPEGEAWKSGCIQGYEWGRETKRESNIGTSCSSCGAKAQFIIRHDANCGISKISTTATPITIEEEQGRRGRDE